jgi:hypothetical protein
VEELARRLAAVVNGAGPESRAGLREYAIELLKEETELGELPAAPGRKTDGTGTNPLGLALLLGLVSLPLIVVFWPIGLTLFAMALVMGLWGLVVTFVRR